MILHYAKVTKAANDTHADCLRIITRAEIRMANEIDEGRSRGEVAIDGRPKTSQSSGGFEPSTLADIGVDSRRLSEWRQVRDAGEEVVEGAIQNALDDGRERRQRHLVASTVISACNLTKLHVLWG